MTESKPSVLVVDDEQDCLEFATVVLEPHYDVRTALSVEACRAALQARKPDVIILDVMMGNLCDGLDLTRELKKTADTADIPVIMLTSVNESYDYRSQMSADFFPHNRWLDKPVKPAALLAAVGKLLEK